MTRTTPLLLSGDCAHEWAEMIVDEFTIFRYCIKCGLKIRSGMDSDGHTFADFAAAKAAVDGVTDAFRYMAEALGRAMADAGSYEEMVKHYNCRCAVEPSEKERVPEEGWPDTLMGIPVVWEEGDDDEEDEDEIV